MNQNRAEIVHKKLSELNNYVNVTWSSEIINEDFLEKHNINVNLFLY